MYSICLESCTSSLLLCSSALNPLGTSQGSSWHMVKTGETCWRLPGCGPQSPDVQWHIVFKQTVSVAETLRKTTFLTAGVFSPKPFSVRRAQALNSLLAVSRGCSYSYGSSEGLKRVYNYHEILVNCLVMLKIQDAILTLQQTSKLTQQKESGLCHWLFKDKWINCHNFNSL